MGVGRGSSPDEQLLLGRVRCIPHINKIYSDTLMSLRSAIQGPEKIYELLGDDLSVRSEPATTVFISQLYSRIRAISDLLIELYRYSQEDLTYNDRRAIQGVSSIRRILDNAFPLYSRHDLYRQPRDILTAFVTQQPIVLNLDLMEDWYERSNAMLRAVFYGLVSTQCAPNTASFSKVSKLAEFISQFPKELAVYAEALASDDAFPTTP